MFPDLEPYRRVLFPTDLQRGTEAAYAHAFRLVVGRAGALHVVHVHDPDTRPDWTHLPSARAMLVRWGRLGPDDGVDAFERLGVTIEFSALPSLELEDPIHDTVAREVPDLLVLPTHARKGMERLAVASVAEDVARQASMPALFLPRDARPFVDADSGSVSLRTVVVAVDEARDARLALQEAMRLVHSFEAAPATFVLVHVGERATVPPLFLAEDDARWDFRIDVRHGPVAKELVASVEAHDADVLVMASRGHDSVFDWLRGSNAEVVVRNAACPVLVVPLRD